mmetsp:Transcript_140712/g.350820  ORF Transcript_140712/g.350820 Transcript_140712/m.350820 type:complete len:396 (+) Transcript_140712:3-1190(+)
MRLMKLRRLLLTLQGMVNSEWVTIVLAVVKNLITTLAVNHFLACIWFWVGKAEGAAGWVAKEGFSDADYGEQYLVSLQWSMAQFTPGSPSIEPHNLSERVMNVTVIALGLILATCFVSSITSTMAAVWNAKRYDLTQHLLLKKFLNQNNVPRALGSRIMHYVDFVLDKRQKRVHVSTVHFLNLISGPLHIELHTELFAPTLCWHPCFSQIFKANVPMMREICTTAILSNQSYAKNDVIFHRGKEAKHTLFLTYGTLVYRFCPYAASDPHTTRLHEGNWCVEAALWMPWHHVGEMRALCEVDIVSVTSAKFREICEGYPQDFPVVRSYALAFWQEAHEREHEVLTDIGYPSLEAVVGRTTSMGKTGMADQMYAEEVQTHLVHWDDLETPKQPETGP